MTSLFYFCKPYKYNSVEKSKASVFVFLEFVVFLDDRFNDSMNYICSLSY